ncbi:CHASE3 domain-containing protein [Bradyrhizobium daqingense]|uniref:histidine kinase n=1 Tax=Bradyrhizobium daqingense TaxID=993502 RepID=A0A562LPR6_9BRAD|nr:ATP-binding protein [Bradyrhizobium daqingense]TWI09624.1 PAS domain S-box-containing protein [Bradyrhizobium daqingense]UFS87953.1 CHASE3 domain-containing protein [Bradyrhizobium daqingense]
MSALVRILPLRWLARPLVLAVGALLTLFAATAILGLQYWQERQSTHQLVGHSRQVLETLDRLRAIIAKLEAERRGYLMTLDPTYLKAYGVSDEGVRREAQALQALVADDPLLSLRAQHLTLIVSAKLREIDEMVKTAGTSGLPALAMIRGMDEIRSQIDQMVDHERFRLAGREAHAEAFEQRWSWLIASDVVLVVGLAAAALALARLETKRRRKTTEENIKLQSDLAARDIKIRHLFDANIIGIIIWEVEGRIFEANDAFLRIVGYDREDLVAGRLHRTDLTPPEWRDRDLQTVAELKRVGTAQAFEKEYVRKDGSRVPVLIGGTMFGEGGDQGVGFVLDLTALKRAEAESREHERRYREALIELAHANRVTTMGQLTASIAHEVNQPIAAIVASAEAGVNWLEAQPPNLERVRQTFGLIAGDGMRAGAIIGRIRALIRKAPPQKEYMEINQAVLEVIALTRSEAFKNGVSVRTQLAEDLPPIQADRVQLQQVMLNLIVNAVEAMASVGEGGREMLISTGRDASNGVHVTLRDSGPGLDPKNAERLFEAFYTTKPTGMGMGLAICRSIIETHGGRMWASANEPRGAVFEFTLPLASDETAGLLRAGEPPALRSATR